MQDEKLKELQIQANKQAVLAEKEAKTLALRLANETAARETAARKHGAAVKIQSIARIQSSKLKIRNKRGRYVKKKKKKKKFWDDYMKNWKN